jgi:hypothetical protein
MFSFTGSRPMGSPCFLTCLCARTPFQVFPEFPEIMSSLAVPDLDFLILVISNSIVVNVGICEKQKKNCTMTDFEETNTLRFSWFLELKRKLIWWLHKVHLFVGNKKIITQIKVWYVKNRGYKQILREVVVIEDNYNYEGQKFWG